MIGSFNVIVTEFTFLSSQLAGRQFLSTDCAEVVSEGCRGIVKNGFPVVSRLVVDGFAAAASSGCLEVVKI